MKQPLSSVIMERGALSVEEVARLVGRRDPVILEIGSNIGQTSAEFLQVIPGARLFCFEPDPRAIAIFKSNIKHPNVTLIESAVGNHNGTITFHQSGGRDEYSDWNQSGSIKRPKDHFMVWPKVTFEQSIEVPIIKLDDWSKQAQVREIDFIWADVQGAEADLIQGGIKTINRSRFFYTEYGFQELYDGQVTLHQIDQYLEKFSISRLFQMDALFENMKLKGRPNNKLGGVAPIGRNDLCHCGSGKKFKLCHAKL